MQNNTCVHCNAQNVNCYTTQQLFAYLDEIAQHIHNNNLQAALQAQNAAYQMLDVAHITFA